MKKIEDLNKLYTEAEAIDKKLFAYQRSNIALVAGNHYTNKRSNFYRRVRTSKELDAENKLRITKNHIQKICKIYRNNILAFSPGVAILPKNESELQDQKCAEMHQSVWEDIKYRHNFDKKVAEFVQDFVDIGECAVKIFWDETKGGLLGHNELLDEAGNVIGKEPVFAGDLVFDRIFGFNLLRDPSAKSMDESRYLIYRKMVDVKDLKAMVGDDEEKLDIIKACEDKTYQIYHGHTGEFTTSDQGKTLVREFYFRPCAEYPEGYFCITVEDGKLFEGKLPGGVFPIIVGGFDEIQTSPRAESIIKQLRPYQAEINRTSSKIAEHQITLGDDKVFIQKGTKIAHGGKLGGIQAIQYTGMTPEIQAGRSGAQYLEYMVSQIREMYEVAGIREDSEEKQSNLDPYSMLFRSMKDKKKFVIYGEKFERFLKEVCDLSLRLYKTHSKPQTIVRSIGRNEKVNIPEFKNMQDIDFQIKVEKRGDDVETVIGKQLSINQLLQYVGSSLSREDIGQIANLLPFANGEQMFSDLTIDSQNIKNDILALDGEFVVPNKHDKHKYVIDKLINRMKQPDFKQLDEKIQETYELKLQAHTRIESEQIQEIARAQSKMIPTSGALIGMDLYVDQPDGKAAKRARVPTDAAQWLLKILEEQGYLANSLKQLPQSGQAQIAQDVTSPQEGGNVTPINNQF